MEIALSLATAFFSSLVSIKVAKPIAQKLDLVDKPNERKQHNGNVPLVGGISIFIAVLISFLLWLPESRTLNLYIIGAALMVFIGALDDKHDLSVRVRVVGQILVASIMIFGAETYIHNLGNLFGFGELDLGVMGIFLTYLAVLGAINAFNMVDGMDGLIGALSIVTFSSISLLFVLCGNQSLIAFPMIIVAAICPYLLFNLDMPFKGFKKIFMGDAGSMFIGFSVIWLLSMGTQNATASFSPVTALWLIAIPLMDMITIMLRRTRKGQSMFKADREHLHHLFIRAGFTDRQALAIISFIASIAAMIGITGEMYQIPEKYMFSLFLLCFLAYYYAIKHSWVSMKLLKKSHCSTER